MDKKALRNKRNKYHASRTHERSNQGILDRVASKVKGWFSNVWSQASQEEPDGSDTNEESPQNLEFTQQAKTFSSKRPRLRLQDNSLSPCSSSSLCLEPPKESNFTSQTSSRGIKRLRLHEHSIPSCSMGIFNEIPCEQDFSPQNSVHSNKRQRLRLPEDSSILSDTQSWLEVPNRPNIFGQASHVPSNNMPRQLIDNKESSIIMNGDDHSENSEGSASTSGCSSLVSHKDRANCISSRILGESGAKDRRDVTLQKESSPGNISTSRISLWSTNDRSEARSIRSPSLILSGQPSFSLSAFSSPSKVNYQVEKRVASPFYQGKTTFGGASASRRMPIAAAPYQTEKPLRNQIKFLSSQSKDSYEGMSSAAKRILQTLEKMSSPVIDAKKIPNTNKSPVDLSLYLMPPKHHKTLQSTPSGPTKGPPIADISTISKLTTIKSYGQKTFQNTLMDSPSLLNEEPCPLIRSYCNRSPKLQTTVPQTTKISPSLASGGGKIRTKLNQQHKPSVKNAFIRMSDMESRMSEFIEAMGEPVDLPQIPLPITSLPTITFGNNAVKSTSSSENESDFVFSNPIEHVVPKTVLTNPCPSLLTYNFLPPLVPTADKIEDNVESKFTFSNPIELEVPVSSSFSSLTNDINATKASSQTSWKCNSCWIQNPVNEIKCMCCEAPNPSKENIKAEITGKDSSVQNSKPSTTSTWECGCCWVWNPSDKSNCLACEAPNPSKANCSVGVQSNEQLLTITSSGFKFPQTSNTTSSSGFVFGTSEPSKSAQNSVTGFKIPTVETKAQTVSFGDFKIPVSKSASSDFGVDKSTSASNSLLKPSSSLTALAKNSIPEGSWECDVCLVKNEENKQKCMACGTLKSNKDFTGYSFRFAKEKDSIPKTTSSNSTSATLLPTINISSGLTSTSSTLASSSATSILNSTTSFAPPTTISVTSCLSVLFSRASDSSISPLTSSKENLDEKSGLLTTSTMTGSSLKISTTEQSPENNSGAFSLDTAKSVNQKLESMSQNPLLQTSNKKLEMSSQQIFNSSVIQQDFAKSCSKQSSECLTTSSFTTTSDVSKCSFQFSSEIKPDSSWDCSNCLVKNEKDRQICNNCNKPQTAENASDSKKTSKPQSIGLEANSSTTSAPVFQFGSQSSISSSATSSFPTVNSTFTFGEKKETSSQLPVSSQLLVPTQGSISQSVSESKDSMKSSKPQSIELEANSSTTSAPAFQFGNPSSISSSATSSFPTVNSTFTFGEKKETSNQLPVSSQLLVPTQGSISQSVFGGSAASSIAFGKASDKSASASPLTFGKASDKPAAGSLVFGKTADKPAASLSFGNTSGKPATGSLAFGNASDKSAGSLPFGNATDKPSAGSLTFGKSIDKPAPGIFSFGTTAHNAAPVFQFGSTVQSASSLWECSNCHVKNDSEKQKCISCDSARSSKNTSGFTFKGSNEIKSNTNSLVFNTPTTTTSATTGFTFNAPVPASTSPFVFGVKSEPATTTSSVFTFGSASASTSKPTVTGFETQSSTAVPSFQFGSQSASTNVTVSTFGAGNSNFTFGAKTGTPNPVQPTPSTQTPTPAFGSAPSQNPLFGNSITSPAFGKQAPGGFNFGLPTATNAAPVFQFGAPEKKPATNSGFSFGTPSQDAANFQPQFNVNTPPSFNFGASSATGPFQFAANTENSQHSSPRRIRKAVRRMK